jgi:hypothetical protein
MAGTSDTFRSQRQRVVAGLPPLEEILRGSVFVRSLRCGKAGCHCASGEGHRVAYLSVTHPGGRTEQISLPADLVATAEQWVSNYKAWWHAIEEMSAINRQVLRQRRRPATPPAGWKKRKRRKP